MSARYATYNSAGTRSETNKYLGEFDYVNQLNEQWFGLCASYKLNENLGIGITAFVVYRGQTSGITNNYKEVNVLDSLASLAISNNTETMKFMTLRLLAKLGLAYQTGRWKFGFSLTTPSVGIYGNGSVKREESCYSSAKAYSGQKSNYIIFAENSSAKAQYYHPVAIGIGIEYHFPKTRISVSGEYYSKINSYYVMKPGFDPFVYPAGISDSSGVNQNIESFLHVGNAAKPVFNIGVGIDQAVGKKINILLGGRTDFSSYTPSEYSNELLPETGTWDLYHLSAGVSYHQVRQSVTLGFSYSFSPVVPINPIVIITPGETMTSKANVFAQLFGVVLGYTYFFPR
jgi:hypothetical protein